MYTSLSTCLSVLRIYLYSGITKLNIKDHEHIEECSMFDVLFKYNFIIGHWPLNLLCQIHWPWIYFILIKGSVQPLSCVRLFVTPWTAAHQASLSITNSRTLLKLMSIELVMPCNHLILSSPSPPAFNLFQHQGFFKWVSSSHHIAKVLEFQVQHQSFQWIFRTDFL